MDKRGFLLAAGGAAGAVMLGGCTATAPKNQQDVMRPEQREFEVASRSNSRARLITEQDAQDAGYAMAAFARFEAAGWSMDVNAELQRQAQSLLREVRESPQVWDDARMLRVGRRLLDMLNRSGGGV